MQKDKSTNIISSSDVIYSDAIFVFIVFILIYYPIIYNCWLYFNHRQKLFFQTKIDILLKSNDVYDYQEHLYSNGGFYNLFGSI